MKINLNQVLTDLDGECIKIEGTEEVIIAKKICVNALTANIANENVDGNERFKRYQIAQRINNSGDLVSLTAEEITKLKELIGKVYTTIIVGRLYEILEQDHEED